MPRVDYIGPAHIRVIRSADFAAAGISSPDMVWDKGNNYERDVSNAVAAFLVAADGNFRAEGNQLFSDLYRNMLEARGAAVKQDALCATLRTNWINFARDAGGASPTQQRQILGGDCIGGWRFDTDGVMWTWLDAWIGANGVDLATNTFKAGVTYLPQRNAGVLGGLAGTLAAQHHDDLAATGQWLLPSDEGLSVNNFWWPGMGVRVGSTDITGPIWLPAHFGDVTVPVEENYGIVGTHIIELNQLLFTYESRLSVPWGTDNNFWLADFWRDGNTVYGRGVVLAAELPDLENTDWDAWRDHRDLGVKLGRVNKDTLTTLSSWEFWNGTTWVSNNPGAAAVLKDNFGNTLHGFTGIPRKVATNHWVAVGREHVFDECLDVWQAKQPEGPWKKIARVPIPFMGGERWSGAAQVCHSATLLPWLTGVTDPDTSIACLTHTLLGANEDTVSEAAWDRTHITARLPEFITIPHY